MFAKKQTGAGVVVLMPVFLAALMIFATVADASRTVQNSVRGAAIGSGDGVLIDGGDGARTGAAAGAVAGAVTGR